MDAGANTRPAGEFWGCLVARYARNGGRIEIERLDVSKNGTMILLLTWKVTSRQIRG